MSKKQKPVRTKGEAAEWREVVEVEANKLVTLSLNDDKMQERLHIVVGLVELFDMDDHIQFKMVGWILASGICDSFKVEMDETTVMATHMLINGIRDVLDENR